MLAARFALPRNCGLQLHPALPHASMSLCVMCSAGLVGLAITSTLNLSNLAQWAVRQLSDTEVAMNRHAPALDHVASKLVGVFQA